MSLLSELQKFCNFERDKHDRSAKLLQERDGLR